MPKLYVGSPQRYQLWRQAHNVPGVLAISSTINCTIGAYEICRHPERWEAEHRTFCQEACGSKRVCSSSALGLRRQCKPYRGVNWDAELPEIRKAGGGMAKGRYLATAMAHRFFLVAPGDFVTTPKLAEAFAMGGAGGPIPVLVLPGRATDASGLPYSSWLDYCEAAYVVSAATAKRDLRGVLDRLARVGAAEAAAKHAALRRLSVAFTVVTGSTVHHPSAAEHVLRSACESARAMNSSARAPAASRRRVPLVPGANRACVL